MSRQDSLTNAGAEKFPEIIDLTSSPEPTHQAKSPIRISEKAQQDQTRLAHVKISESCQDSPLPTFSQPVSRKARSEEEVEPTSSSKVDQAALRHAISLTMPEPESTAFAAGKANPITSSDHTQDNYKGMSKTRKFIEKRRQARRKQAAEFVNNDPSSDEEVEDVPFSSSKPTAPSATRTSTPLPSIERFHPLFPALHLPSTPLPTNEEYAALHPVSPLPPPPAEALSRPKELARDVSQETNHGSTSLLNTFQGPTVLKHQAMEWAVEELKLGFPVRVIVKIGAIPTKKRTADMIFSVNQVKEFNLLKEVLVVQFGTHIKKHMDSDSSLDILLFDIRVVFTDRDGSRKDAIKTIHGPATYNIIIKRLLCMHSSLVNLCCCGVCKSSENIPEVIVSIRYLADQLTPRTKREEIAARQNPRNPDFIISYNELNTVDEGGARFLAAISRHGDAAEPKLAISPHAIQNLITNSSQPTNLQNQTTSNDKQIARFKQDKRRNDRKIETLTGEASRLKKDLAKAQRQIRDLQAQLATRSNANDTHNGPRRGTPERPSISPLTTPFVSDNEGTIAVAATTTASVESVASSSSQPSSPVANGEKDGEYEADSESSKGSAVDGKRRQIRQRATRASKRVKSGPQTQQAAVEHDQDQDQDQQQQTAAPDVEDPDSEVVREAQGFAGRRACTRRRA